MFQKKFNFERRLAESSRIRHSYPNRVPVIIQRASCCKDVEPIDKCKYLVPSSTSVAQLIAIIRKRIPDLTPDKSIFIFVNDTTMPPSASTLLEIDDTYRNKDGFVYVYYAGESTFG